MTRAPAAAKKPAPAASHRCSLCAKPTVYLFKGVRYCTDHHPDPGPNVIVWPDEDEIRAAAVGCTTYAHLWRKFPRASIEWIRHVSEKHALGLEPDHRVAGPATPGRACPKPEKRAKA